MSYDFLNRIAKDVKFTDVDDESEKPIVESKQDEQTDDLFFDTSSLFENDSPSILKDIRPSLTEEDKNFFRNLDSPKTSNTSLSDESSIRKIMREELEKFFKEKTVLHESANPEIIYFKIGNTLFKGTLEQVE